MRKAFVFVLVFVCAFSAFASKNAIDFKFTPMATQISTSSDEPEYKVISEFGMGAEISYRRYVSDFAFVNGGIAWNSFSLPEGRPCFTSIMPFAGVGVDYGFCDSFKASLTAGVGLDSLVYDKLISESITIKADIRMDFIISDKVNFVLGCGGTMGFAKKGETNYKNYRIIPEVGMNIGL